MHKKLLIAVALLLSHPATLLAKGIPYLGASLGVQNTEGYNGLLASAAAGYSLTVGEYQNYYFAGEIFGDTGSIPLSQTHFRRTNYGFGASLIPGLILRETVLAYLRMGVETFRYSGTDNFFTGGQLGFGLQTSITDNWDIRGEYVYTGKGITRNFGTSRFNIFKLGVVFKFK